MTLSDYLRGLTNYPLSEEALQSILSKRGASDKTEYEAGTPQSLLVAADLYHWLSTAPDISQGGQSYSLLYSTREQLRKRANELYRLAGEPVEEATTKVRYGYKGERL